MTPLELSFTVDCSPAHAFDIWANRTSLWWPKSHSVSADPGLSVTFEPRVGGRIYERTPDGTEHQWGEILTWDPPRRLRYLWHIVGDRSDATEVDITFEDASGATAVTIVHRGWERLGSTGPEMRRRNRQGWAGLLPHFQEAVVDMAGTPWSGDVPR